MKTILVIDESELFRDYIQEKLEIPGVEVETAINGLDGIVKIRNTLPDLVIIDYNLTRKTVRDVLDEKMKNPNTASIPVILTAQKIDRNNLLELAHYNIKKAFMKPVKIDGLYAMVSDILGVAYTADNTPCILEAHVNDNIIFIEIAKGLNREKIDLLRFKLDELLSIYQIRDPRVLLLVSDMSISFVDAPNIEKLMRVIVSHSEAKPKYIKVITNQKFFSEYLSGNPEFSEIEAVSNLQYAVDGLFAGTDVLSDPRETRASVISERVLAADNAPKSKEAVDMRFSTEKEEKKYSSRKTDELGMSGKKGALKIAIVDDDFVIQELVKTTFTKYQAVVDAYGNGREFLDVAKTKDYDLVFLDLLMPVADGFDVLREMGEKAIDSPVIILSAVSHRDSVIRAFQSGVKSYLIKPIKPEQIAQKTLEILKSNF